MCAPYFSGRRENRAEDDGAGKMGVTSGACVGVVLYPHGNQPQSASSGRGAGTRSQRLQSPMDGKATNFF